MRLECFNKSMKMADTPQFQAINAKLKKRYSLVKPNYAEASKKFMQLSSECQDLKIFAGHCCLAAARCEHNLNNFNLESRALLQSARYFRSGGELNAAISAYRHAILLSQSSILQVVYIELAQMYEQHQRYREAALTYEEASLFKKAAYAHMDDCNYDKALLCFNKTPKSSLKDDDLVSIFLLKLHLFDIHKTSFDLPVIPSDTENERIIATNVLLESLMLLVKDGNDEERSKLIFRLEPLLHKRHRDLLNYCFADRSTSGHSSK